jgi:hypothetical protein
MSQSRSEEAQRNKEEDDAEEEKANEESYMTDCNHLWLIRISVK